MRADDARIIPMQRIFRRTHTGRSIRSDAAALLARASDSSRGLVECPNCGFVLGEEYFVNGCPNCHSREAINNGEQR